MQTNQVFLDETALFLNLDIKGYSVNIWGFITLYHLLQHSPQGLIHCPGNTQCLMPMQKKSGLIAHTSTPKLSLYCVRSVLLHCFPMARYWRMWLLGNVFPTCKYDARFLHLGDLGFVYPSKLHFIFCMILKYVQKENIYVMMCWKEKRIILCKQ